MKNRILSVMLYMMLSVVAVSVQAQVAQKKQESVKQKEFTDGSREERDTSSESNHNKTFYISLGIGTAELINLNLGVHLFKEFYATVNYGYTHVTYPGALFGSLGATFYKLGLTWRMFPTESTFLLSLEGGKAQINVQESTPTQYFPNQATVASLLAGYEWRYQSGFNLGLRGGIKYSRVQTQEDRFAPGFQVSAGFFF